VTKKHAGPSPADRQLFKLWDAIEAERSQRGERAALALANKALKAIEPATAPAEKERNQWQH
jgi:hypothetical protein